MSNEFLSEIIHAKTTPFDDSNCEHLEAKNVQEAIDELCEAQNETLVAIRLVPGGDIDCIEGASVLVDSTVCYIKKEEC